MKLQFRDAAIHISSTADGDLSIAADDEIDLTSTLIDINGNATVSGTLGVTGIATFTDDIIIGDGKTIGSASDVDAITIASNGQLTLTQTLIGTALDISGDIDVDGTTNLDIVDIDGAVDMASTLIVDGKTGLGIDPSTLPSFVDHAMKISNGGGLSITSPSSGDNRLIFFGTGTSSADVQLAAIKNTSSDFIFLGASGAERFKIHNNGVVAPLNGIALGVGTANTASNVLDDYEEGTWTPTLQNYGGTPTIQSAIYTKVGRLVYVSCAITLDGTSDASGFAITSFPFTSLNTDSSAEGGVVTFTDSDKDDITILVANNSAAANIMQTDGSTYTYNEFGNDKQLRCMIIYSTA